MTTFQRNRTGAWWVGDNPYIRLYDRSGSLDHVVSYFDVSYSEFGASRALFLLSGLAAAQGRPEMRILAESRALGEFLRDQLVVEFTGFRETGAVSSVAVELAEFSSGSADPQVYQVQANGAVSVTARWSNPLESFYYQTRHQRLPAEFSSAFIPCETGEIEVDGKPLVGTTVPDHVEGREVTSACLALAEVWFRV